MQTLDRTTELGKKLFYASYILMLVRSLLSASMLSVVIGTDGVFFRYILRIAALIPIFIKLCTQDRFEGQTLLRYVIFACAVALMIAFNSHSALVDIAVLIVGVHGVSLKDAVRVFFRTASVVCGALFLLSILGVIENLVIYTGLKPRYSFGSVYPTDFAATLFYIELAHAYLKGKNYNLRNFFFWIVISFFVLVFCVARLDFILIFCFAWAMLLAAYVPKLFSFRGIRAVLWLMIPVLCVGSILLHVVYTPENKFFAWMNGLLSGRLYYGNLAVNDYGFTLFGQVVRMQGWGFTTTEWDSKLGYYFVDCGWLSLALQYGIVMVVFVCAVYTAVSRKSFKEGDHILPIILFFIALTSVVDHHLFEYWFNPFLLVLNMGLCAGRRKSTAARSAVAAGTV